MFLVKHKILILSNLNDKIIFTSKFEFRTVLIFIFRVVGQLAFINKDLASKVAKKVGVKVIQLKQPNGSIPADADPATL